MEERLLVAAQAFLLAAFVLVVVVFIALKLLT